MGYDVHITRKLAWYDDEAPEISLDEWLHHVAGDPELRLDGHAEARPGGGAVLGVEDPSMAVWIGHPEHGKRDGMAWIWHSNGNVMAKNPYDAMLRKMHRIGVALGAKVQGDEGEIYGPDGDPLPGDDSSAAPATVSGKQPW